MAVMLLLQQLFKQLFSRLLPYLHKAHKLRDLLGALELVRYRRQFFWPFVRVPW